MRCDGKRKWADRKTAERIVRHMVARKINPLSPYEKKRLRAYHCTICGCYHIGKKVDFKGRRRKGAA